jgi:hypothetical protein
MSAEPTVLRFPTLEGAEHLDGELFTEVRRRTLSDDAMAALEVVLADAPRASRDQPRTSG